MVACLDAPCTLKMRCFDWQHTFERQFSRYKVLQQSLECIDRCLVALGDAGNPYHKMRTRTLNATKLCLYEQTSDMDGGGT